MSLRDVTVGPDGRVFVAAANGTLYSKGTTKQRWTAHEVAGSALRAVDVFDGHVVVSSANNRLFRRPVDGRTRWRKSTAPTGNGLLTLALDHPDVAGGQAGTVVTRKSAQPPAEKPDTRRTEICRLLRTELVSRLDRAELVELLERRETCDSTVVELLDERRTGPERGVRTAGRRRGIERGRLAGHRDHGTGTRWRRTSPSLRVYPKPDRPSALERLLCD